MKKNLKRIITEKGQGLTEYVLILAFVAGIAMMMFGGGLKETVASTFNETVEILANLNSTKSNYYAEHFEEYHMLKRAELQALGKDKERVDMDLSALQNIADGLIGKDLQWLFDNFPASESYVNHEFNEAGHQKSIAMVYGTPGYNPYTLAKNIFQEGGGGQLGAIRDGTYLDSSTKKTTPAILSLIHGTDSYDNSSYSIHKPDDNGAWSKQGYFYSDGMIGVSGQIPTNINVKVTTDGSSDNPKITGAHVWVSGSKTQSLLESQQGTNGTTLAQGVKAGNMK